MNLIMKMRKNVGKLLLITMLVQLIGGAIPTHASSQDEIDLSLSILNPKDSYYPNETLVLGANWGLPDDTVNKQFEEGYQFSITFPNSLSPQFDKITLGDMGTGVVEGNKIVFTFNENVEQLMDRKGGFNLSFKINDPNSESKEDTPIELKDNFGNTLIKEVITIDGSVSDIGYTQESSLTKGSYGMRYGGYTDGVSWYLRVNEDKTLSTNNNTIIVRDEVVGDNHVYDINSFEVSRQVPDGLSVGNDKVDLKKALKLSPDKKSFELTLDVSDKSWYNVNYKTIYVGDPSEDMKDNKSAIDLYNKVKVIEESGAIVYPGSSPKEVVSKGEFSLSGWAEGKLIQGGMGKAHIKKIDKHTKEPIPGVKFEITHMWNGRNGPVFGNSHTVTTDSNGIAYLSESDIYGSYQIKEVVAADGYILDNRSHIVNIEAGKDTEIILENSKAPRDIYISKEWLDENNNSIDPQESVEFILYADDIPVRKLVFTKDMKDAYFKNLPIYNDGGDKIAYRVEEVSIENYSTTIEYNNDEILVVNQVIPKEIQLKNIEVNKTWIDTDGNKIDPQEDIEIVLLANGVEVNREYLSVEKDSITFSELPVSNEDGEEILYTIDEISSDDYEVAIEYFEDSISIINKLIPSNPEDTEDDKPVEPEEPVIEPVEPEDTEDDKPVEPEEPVIEPVEPEDTEDDKPVEPEEPIIEPVEPEDTEDDKPVEPEEPVIEPVEPEDTEDDKPVEPEEPVIEPEEPEDTEDDKPVEPEEPVIEPEEPEDTEDDKPVEPEEPVIEPVEPEDTEDDKPVEPEEPVIEPVEPEDTEDDKPVEPEEPVIEPVEPEDTEDDKPVEPEEPIIEPEDTEDDKPVEPEKPVIEPEDTDKDSENTKELEDIKTSENIDEDEYKDSNTDNIEKEDDISKEAEEVNTINSAESNSNKALNNKNYTKSIDVNSNNIIAENENKSDENLSTLPKTGEVNTLNQLLLGLFLIIVGAIGLKIKKKQS